MRRPVRSFGIDAPVRDQHIFNQKRHHIGQARRSLFGIGEPGNIAARDQWLAIRGLGVAKDCGRMADGGDRFAATGEMLDQVDADRVLCQIPQRSMAARLEHGIEGGQVKV